MSHPVWVRGLKRVLLRSILPLSQVAPRVGAWIETHAAAGLFRQQTGRTPCGCVD